MCKVLVIIKSMGIGDLSILISSIHAISKKIDKPLLALLKTLRALSGAETVVLIEHTDRNGGAGDEYPSDLLNFLHLVENEGLWLPAVVRDHGCHLTLRMVQLQHWQL